MQWRSSDGSPGHVPNLQDVARRRSRLRLIWPLHLSTSFRPLRQAPPLRTAGTDTAGSDTCGSPDASGPPAIPEIQWMSARRPSSVMATRASRAFHDCLSLLKAVVGAAGGTSLRQVERRTADIHTVIWRFQGYVNRNSSVTKRTTVALSGTLPRHFARAAAVSTTAGVPHETPFGIARATAPSGPRMHEPGVRVTGWIIQPSPCVRRPVGPSRCPDGSRAAPRPPPAAADGAAATPQRLHP